jgi:hypothetical protein
MIMAETIRQPRDLETRAKMERPTKWMPPQLLPDPNPEPGFAFRWIRISTLNNSDPPVKASDHPEIRLMSGQSSRFPDSVEIGGLLLCKTPVEFVEQRDAYYRQQADAQMNSVDNTYMRENDPRMPMFKERKSQVTFGKGT